MINYRSLVRGRGVAGSTCGPVKAEIAGSNPVAPARQKSVQKMSRFLWYIHNPSGFISVREERLDNQGVTVRTRNTPKGRKKSFPGLLE